MITFGVVMRQPGDVRIVPPVAPRTSPVPRIDAILPPTPRGSSMPDTSPQRPAPAGTAPWSQLRAIIESLADGIVIVDPRGAIRFANPAAGRLFNRTPEQLIGTMLGTPLVAGETTEMEIVRRGGGDVVYAELRVVETEWEGETVELVSLRDVTDRKDADERVRQLAHEREARLQAEATSRTKSDFLAIMSHELRTPLNAILGYSELIELGLSGDVSNKMRDQLARIRDSAKHLLALVNDILDLSRVEAGRLTVAHVPASAMDAIVSALPLVQPQATVRNLQIVVAPGADLLPPYIGDAERVRQILVNLLSNSVKCTEPGGTITTESQLATGVKDVPNLDPRQSYIRISVSDTGSGIPPERLGDIFEPFVQVDSGHKRTREGSGLGLTIALRLARAMGGNLTVESTMGQGSSFHLWLPADESTSAEAASVAPTAGTVSDGLVTGVTRRVSGVPDRRREFLGLGALSRELLSKLELLVTTVTERMRCDPTLRVAAGLRTSQVTDHLATLLADIAGTLLVVEEAGGDSSPLLADAMEIQRLIAERHGAQRARLGWTEASLRREFMIIREELERVVRRSVPSAGALTIDDALAAVNKFIDQAEYIGVRKLERERGA